MANRKSKNSLTVSQVNQDFAKAQRALAHGPLIITTRGQPTLVLMRYESYLGRAKRRSNLMVRLHVPGQEKITFEASKLAGAVNPAEFD